MNMDPNTVSRSHANSALVDRRQQHCFALEAVVFTKAGRVPELL
jgi:hypothetical protein